MRQQLRKTLIENPWFNKAHADDRTNPRLIPAMINTRSDTIVWLVARRKLDRAQEAAANRFRAHYEAMGGRGAGAVDYERTPVDGGPGADPISARQIAAGHELARCHALLGSRGYRLVSMICGEGLTLHDIGTTRRERDAASVMLALHLADLALLWGMAGGRKR